VVIPALDEADRIEDAIRTARGPGVIPARDAASAERGRFRRGGIAGEPEILVVDGGSRDDTAIRARRAGARVLRTDPGRARQLEAGWRASSGEVVVFLHADTRLDDGWTEALRAALVDPAVVGGAFRLRFAGEGLGLRVLEAFVALRVRVFGLPYGDQAIFVRRRILEEMGGIPQVPLMEDIDLVAGMKARGRVVALAPAATTSSRRYAAQGLWRTAARHVLALAGWRLGVDRARIGRWVGR